MDALVDRGPWSMTYGFALSNRCVRGTRKTWIINYSPSQETGDYFAVTGDESEEIQADALKGLRTHFVYVFPMRAAEQQSRLTSTRFCIGFCMPRYNRSPITPSKGYQLTGPHLLVLCSTTAGLALGCVLTTGFGLATSGR